MMKIKNKLHLLPFFLMSYLAFFFLININPVIAMDNNNKDKQIKNYEVSDKEINDFFVI
uniref:SVM family protein n=1 Tax=Candidatus Phytoplasma asiaticum TaxID=2763338 RepID=UPI00201342ED|nr:SVM family protein ['Parthenium hysterophorus' phyllody phytoplasma]